ncbi:MAG: hypothetical protein KY393_06410, partial [Actinobacteria bacterium]|nr:hypothetical protein [Actinomycetota bacterium]
MLIAAGYFIYVAANLPDLIAAVNWSSDAAWARVVALELLPSRGAVNVGEASHLSTLWFLYFTRALPMREAIWDVSPYMLSLAGLAFTGWACWRVAGRWAALLGAAIGVAAGSSVLITVLPQGLHEHTWAANGILAAYLVFLKTHRDNLGRLPRLAAGSVAAGGAGLTAASDPLFLASGLGPFVAAGIILWMVYRNSRNRLVAVTAAIVGGTAVVLAFLIGLWMHELGFRKTYLTDGYFFGSMQDLLASLQALLVNLLRLGNGYFFGQPLNLYSLATLGMGLLALVAVVLPVLRTLSIVRHRPGLSEKNQGAALYLLYFSLSIAGVIGAYCLSGFTVGGAASGTRYLVPVFYAVAASVRRTARRRRTRQRSARCGRCRAGSRATTRNRPASRPPRPASPARPQGPSTEPPRAAPSSSSQPTCRDVRPPRPGRGR